MASQDIGVAYVHVEPSGKGFGKSIEGDIGDAVDKASKKGSGTLIGKIGGAFGKIGKIGTGAITTIAGGITALAAKGGFTRALNIENAQAKLKGLGHDSASVTEIMNDALASVKGTAFGLGDAATVAASLSASGVKEGGELTQVLKTVADTAQISGRSLTDIGTIFGSVAARGKLQGDDMLQLMSSGIPVLQMLGKHLNKTSAEVSDMVSDGKIDFQTFADAMKEGLGGAAQSAGTTFTGALANVKAALSRLGETAATPVLNGLRGLFNQAIPLIDAFTAAVKPTLEKVGAGLQKGLEQAIPTVTAFFDKLGKSQTVQQFASYLASLKDDLKELGSSLSGAAGAVWNVISEPLSELYNQAKGQLPAVADGFKTLLHAVSGLLDYASAHADAIIPLAKGVTALILASKGIGAVSAGFKALPAALDGISRSATGITAAAKGISGFVNLANDLGGIGPALKLTAGNFGIVQTAVGTFKAVVTAARTTWGLFTGLLAANPFILVIAGVTALVSALTWFFTQTQTGRQLWNDFATWFTGIWNQISTACQPILQAIATFITQTMGQIQQIWQTGWTLITTIFQNVWNTIGPIITVALALIITGIQTFITTITPLIQAGIQIIQTIFQTAATIIGAEWNGLWTAIATIVQGAWNIVTTVISTALAVVQGVIQAVLAVISGNWSGAWAAIQGIVSAVWGGIRGVVSAGVSMVSGVISAACSTIRSVWSALWNGVRSIVSSVWGGIVGTVSNMVSRVGSIVGNIGSTVRSAVSGAGSWLVDAGRNIIQGLINGITGMVSSLYSSITHALSGLVDKAKNALGIHSPSRVFRDEVGVMVGRGLALGIDDSAAVVDRSMDSLVSSMSLDGTDWSKTGRLNVTGVAGGTTEGDIRELIAAVESLHDDLGPIIARYAPTISDRDFARKVRNAIA